MPTTAVLRRSVVSLTVIAALVPAAAIAAPAAPAAEARSVAAERPDRESDARVASRRPVPSRTSDRPATSRSASRSSSVAAAISGPNPSLSSELPEETRPARAARTARAARADRAERAAVPAPPPAPEPSNERGAVFATVGKQALVLPDGVLGVGFHESGTLKALAMVPAGRSVANHNSDRVATPADAEDGAEYFVLPTRRRAAGGTSAVDIRVEPDVPVTAPVTGTVKAVSTYALYGKYTDVIVEIVPKENPDLLVRVLHISGVGLSEGDEVVAAETVIAERSRQLAFSSQIDRYAGHGPHVHVEVHSHPPGVEQVAAMRAAEAAQAAEAAEAEAAAEQAAEDEVAKGKGRADDARKAAPGPQRANDKANDKASGKSNDKINDKANHNAKG